MSIIVPGTVPGYIVLNEHTNTHTLIVVFRKNGNSPYLYIFWQVRKPMVARKNDPFISLFERKWGIYF